MSVTRGVAPAPQVSLPGAAPAGPARSLALRAALVCLASAGIAAGVATLSSNPRSNASSSAPAPSAPPAAIRAAVAEISAVPAGEAAAFGVLRRARTAHDDFRQIRPGAGPLGANPGLARTVLAPANPGALVPRLVSVVPASGAVCLRVLAAQGYARWWCLPTARAIRGSLIVALLAASPTPRAAAGQFVLGLVPDGVSTVTIRSAGGVGHKLAVRSNVYATAVFRPVSVAFKLPGRGPVSYRIRD